MKNICFLIGNLDNSGGTERVTSIVANELVIHGYNISILNLNNGTEPFFKLNSNIQIQSLFSKKVSFRKNFPTAVLKIRKFVKQYKIDTLIVVDSISCIFTVPALYGLNIKHICWEHFNFNNNNGIKSRDTARKLAARYCDVIVTLTKRDKELWQQSLKNIRAEIIPIANPSPYENIQNIPTLDYKVVLSVGRLTYVKGFDLLIKAWASFCEANLDWILRIVGSGEEEEALKNQAKLLGIVDRIDFIPSTKDVEYYYQTSSFYCLSSRSEGLPMVLIEAQAFGLPVLAFDCDTGPSDIIENCINGYLVEERNTNSLALKLHSFSRLTEKEYNKFVVNSKYKNKNFYIKNIIEQWKNVL